MTSEAQVARALELKRELLRRQAPKLFLAKYHHTDVHHRRLRFDARYRFLVELYKEMDKYPQACFRKSVQCFPADALVWTEFGQKRIDQIVVGDRVWTHKGELRPVLQTMQRQFDGDLITLAGYGHAPITTTDEHPIYAGDEAFASAADASVTVTPKLKAEMHHQQDIVIANMFGDKVLLKNSRFKARRSKVSLPQRIPHTREFFRLIGYYLAEGYCSFDGKGSYRVGFSFHKDEKRIIKDLCNCMQVVFGIRGKKYTYDNCTLIHYYSKSLFTIFKNLLGNTCCENKQIPAFVFHSAPELQAALVEGYVYGDAAVSQRQVKLVSMSSDLLQQLELLCNMLGIKGTLSKEAVWTGKNATILTFSGQEARRLCSRFTQGLKTVNATGKLGTKILEQSLSWTSRIVTKRKHQYTGTVYNLRVQDHDSYIVNSVAVHNCGITELLIVTAFEEASKGLRILYVLPNINLRSLFVRDRIDVMLKIIPLYRSMVTSATGDASNVGLKHFGQGLLNFVGSNSPADFVSFPADSLIIDEVDKCDRANIEMAPDRLDASEYKHDRRAGNPSVEGWGIDAVYQQSTQAQWFVKCQHCGTKQTLDFFKGVVKQTGEAQFSLLAGSIREPKYLCIKCHKPVDRLAAGEWIHAKKTAHIRGYHISQLFSANVALGSLTDQFFKAIGSDLKMQIFYNSKLGLPYAAKGAKITLDLLEAAAQRSVDHILTINRIGKCNSGKTYVGIDVGKNFHVIARERLNSGHRKLVFVGRLSTETELADILTQLDAKLVVIDGEPETLKVADLKKRFKRLYSADYIYGRTLLDMRKSSAEYKKERKVKIDRTFILDSVKQDFETQKMINPANAREIGNEDAEEFGEYYQHMLSSTRTFNESSGRFEWRESTADHFLHAEAFCKLADEMSSKVLEYYKQSMTSVDEAIKSAESNDKVQPDPLLPKTRQELEVMTAEGFLQRLSSRSANFFKKKSEDV